MAKVLIENVKVLDNPTSYLNPFQFEITFLCLEDLSEDLEWKIIYVGSAESEDHDQTLDSVLVGPVPAGHHMFVFQANSPKTCLIPEEDALGVTVVLITCAFRSQEFVRVGYYVNNEYSDPEMKENPPAKPQFNKVVRNILDSNPRITRFTIDWEDTMNSENIPPTQQQQNISQQSTSSAPCPSPLDKLTASNDLAVPLSTDSNSSLPEYVSAMEH
ncbi:histone chaperone asf1b-B-like [Asterias rubens]|uniref:histone chaperone asf1b-B-like n=1 Tax=Asterias rubens TaxID=7604 RepID=UPI001455374D|nr:histone chaperone asf1b-B-like [Asterias rubens]